MPRNNLDTGRIIGLPPVIFLFTLDQIAFMINIEETTLRNSYLYYVGRSTGLIKSIHMKAINIADSSDKPDWRVSHQDFVAWLKRRGFTVSSLSKLNGR